MVCEKSQSPDGKLILLTDTGLAKDMLRELEQLLEQGYEVLQAWGTGYGRGALGSMHRILLRRTVTS